jgi:hypothetical protein
MIGSSLMLEIRMYGGTGKDGRIRRQGGEILPLPFIRDHLIQDLEGPGWAIISGSV